MLVLVSLLPVSCLGLESNFAKCLIGICFFWILPCFMRCDFVLVVYEVSISLGVWVNRAQREAELQKHWRVEHAERKAQLKERLLQCQEELARGIASISQFCQISLSDQARQRTIRKYYGIVKLLDTKRGVCITPFVPSFC